MELWGGLECSRVRIQDSFVDQLELGSYRRSLDDLDALAAIGIRKLRIPLLWEHIWPDPSQEPDWSWPDAALARLNKLGVEPIVGLLHHGSGPADTSLLDEKLPGRLAAFAGKVAQRYPWVRHYTPVNEPLTTARFSCLYGFWYPHAQTDEAFVNALLVQVQAIRLSMRAIRQHAPYALLVQTEDLGFTQAPAALAYQASFENERRWLTFDLLTGKVGSSHALYRYLVEHGASRTLLAEMRTFPCPPSLIGINHYVTSERYLDRRLNLYPAHRHGGNGRHGYVDVETCRSPMPRLGPAALMVEAWKRYRLPIAVTEAHLGFECPEQMRWFYQMWQACLQARQEGADVRACTGWALTGSYDWDSLLTQARGHFETSAFILQNDQLQPTPLALLMQNLAQGNPVNEIATQPGWWDIAEAAQNVKQVEKSRQLQPV